MSSSSRLGPLVFPLKQLACPTICQHQGCSIGTMALQSTKLWHFVAFKELQSISLFMIWPKAFDILQL